MASAASSSNDAVVRLNTDATTTPAEPVKAPTGFRALLRESKYSLWVLAVLVLVYLTNQLDRYTLAIVQTDSEKALDFSDTQYQLMAGPLFTFILTTVGLPVSFFADRFNRKNMLTLCLVIWSMSTFCMGYATNYGEIVAGRIGVAVGESGCNPLANGLIAEYFNPTVRGTAMGVYNWGIYTGYSMAYGVGNWLLGRYGYEMVFKACGLASLPVALLLFFTVKEPVTVVDPTKPPKKFTFFETARVFFQGRSLFLLCMAGAVRNAAGYVWAYNTNSFFENYRGQTSDQIAQYMGWIPLVGGVLGATFGGFISDHVIKNRGSWARIYVLIASQVCAAPFAAGALLLPVPYAYFSSGLCSIVGEMWVGVTLAVVIELVPVATRVSASGVYFFIISNVAGAVQLLVSPLADAFHSTQASLLVLFPGLYVASSLLFFLTLTVLRKDLEKAKLEQTGSGETERLLPAAAISDAARGDAPENDAEAAAAGSTRLHSMLINSPPGHQSDSPREDDS